MKKFIDKTLESSYLLEDVRQIWRDTAPQYNLSQNQKEQLKKLISKIQENLKTIIEEIE